MNLQNRNRLMMLFILAFPFAVIVGFVMDEYFHPPPATPPPALTDTNSIQSPR